MTEKGKVTQLSEEELKSMNTNPEVNISDADIQKLADKSGDTPEHIREMLKLNETGVDAAKHTTTSDVKTGDDLLAGKYKSQEDLDKGFQSLVDKYGKEKAYKMLEKGMSDSSPDSSTDIKDDKDGAKGDQTQDALSGEASTDDNSESTLDFDKFYTEYTDNEGKLSDASYTELKEAGLNKDVVDSYIKGMEAQATLYTQEVYELAGGEEQYSAMIDWSINNLSDAEKIRFNEAIQSNDSGKAKVMLDALKHRYTESQGSFKRNALESSDTATSSTAVGYESTEQMKSDMADPRYKAGDLAFHNMVKTKIANSKIM